MNMATECCDGKLTTANSLDKEQEDDEEEEALSLSDLPVDKDENQPRKEEAQPKEAQEDFNFNSCSNGSVLAKSEMCAADEVFFQGQILPFRHSVSSETGLAMLRTDTRLLIPRSQSMDHRYTGSVYGFTSGSSTRSSSIRSDHNSLSSGSSSSTTRTLIKQKPPRARTRNQFHSHPSPTPQIRVSTSRHGNSSHQRSQKSTIWSFIRVGVVRAPQINPKNRNGNYILNTGNNFGSHNSTSSTNSSASGSISGKLKDFVSSSADKKKKPWTLIGGCKCSVDQTVVDPRLVSLSDNTVDCEKEAKAELATKKKKRMQKRKGKQAMARHRTFEWLKQLSLDGGPA